MTQGRFLIEFLDAEHLDEFCVYRIWFGHHFYIGSTTRLLTRMACHVSDVSRSMEYGYRYRENSITKIANLLSENQLIKTAFVEVIETCVSEVELVEAEYKHLKKVHGSKFCLNVRANTSRKIGDTIYRPAEVEAIRKERRISDDKLSLKEFISLARVQKSLRNLRIIQ